jgi:protein gp37
MSTAIEWTDATWNPVTGCTKVSPGCASCYIERTPAFRMTGQRFERGRIPVRLHHDRLEQPLRWRKPRRVFVVSMGDLFHEDVPDGFISQVWSKMYASPKHTFQVLTKRPERMRRWLERCGDGGRLGWMTLDAEEPKGYRGSGIIVGGGRWPLPNVWLGVSVENQRMADERIPLLLETPAAVRFLSCEPLLGPLWFERGQYLAPGVSASIQDVPGLRAKIRSDEIRLGRRFLDWVIVGGESGPGRAERKLVERYPPAGEMTTLERQLYRGTGWRPTPIAHQWVTAIRDQCQAAGVPFFLKQWGGPRPKAGGRLLDGREWNEMPS